MRIWLGVRTRGNIVMSRYIKLYILIPVLAYNLVLPGIGLAEEVPGIPVIDMDRIMQIESGGNAKAYNKYSGARGLYQITDICLMDFNRLNKTDYSPKDMHDPQKCARVAHWYMNTRIPSLFKAYGIADSVDRRLVAYNAGIRAVMLNLRPKETRDYIVKYHKGGV